MPREIVVDHGGQTSRFTFEKVDRAKLYGRRRRVPLDPAGERCTRAELTADGALLLRLGMTAQGYFDEEDRWHPSRDLVSIWPDGTPAEKVDSTLNTPQPAEEVDATELLDHRVDSVYALDEAEVDATLRERLEGGAILKLPFAYRTGYNASACFLVANPAGVFALIGQRFEADWCDLASAVALDDVEDDGLDDDLDFEMF